MDAPIRIAVDARPLSYPLTGIGQYLKYILSELQVIDNINHYVLISNAPIKFELINGRWEKIEGRVQRKLLSTAWMQLNGPVIVNKKKIDLFWGPRHHLPLMMPRTIKTVVTIHDIVHLIHPDTMQLPNLWVERLLVRKSLNRSDAIITDAHTIANDLINIFQVERRKLFTVYPGIPDIRQGASNGGIGTCALSKNYFLFVGTLEPRKNFERIFKAFESIQPERRDVDMVVVGGTGWKNSSFMKQIDTHPMRSRIKFAGYVPRGELSRYYNNALCLMYPSIYEGFGFPILEAMHSGTPVITSNRSSMPEVADKAAILVDPLNVEEIASAMIQIIDNEMFRKRLIKKGKQRVKCFSWRNCAERILQIITTVMKP